MSSHRVDLVDYRIEQFLLSTVPVILLLPRDELFLGSYLPVVVRLISQRIELRVDHALCLIQIQYAPRQLVLLLLCMIL